MNISLRPDLEQQSRALIDGRKQGVQAYPRSPSTPDTKPYHGRGAAPLSKPQTPTIKPHRIEGYAYLSKSP